VTEIEKLIILYEEEKKMMLRCADLNRREQGDSYFMQRAIECDKIVRALKQAIGEKP